MVRIHRGFTLIEVLIAVAIIVILAGASVAVFGVVRESSRRRGTLALVEALTAAIAAYGQRDLTVPNGSGFRTFAPLFNLNHNRALPVAQRDNRIDGSPATSEDAAHEGGFDPLIVASGYAGAVATLKLPLPASRLNARRQPIDFWGHPLRIEFHPTDYGTRGFRIWSPGPDGVDGTADDLPRADLQ